MTPTYTAARRQICELRLAAQGLGAPAFETPVQVVQHMLAMQAQDFPGAKWSVGLRTHAATDRDVEAAIAARQIVRSWPIRGTLHFTAREDLGWMLSLTRDRMVRAAAGRHRQLELDDESFALAARVAEKSLSSAATIGRSALLAAFNAAGLSTGGQRGNHLLWYLNVTGLLVFGPVEGKQHSFALFENWIGEGRRLDGDEALEEFVRRYFYSHGPATIRDFAWWSSLTLTDARRGLAAVTDEVESLDIEDATYYHRPGLEPVRPGISVLPGFDEYVLGYQDRGAPLAAQWSDRIVPGGNGMFFPTVVDNGEIVGTWKRTSSAKQATITIDAFTPAALMARGEFGRYEQFLGTPVRVL